MIRLSENLHALLQIKGVDAQQLARTMRSSVEAVQMWLSGKSEPSLGQVLSLANYFQVSITHLLTGDVRPVPKIKLLTLDVDGVLTDGGIYLTERGDEIKKFHARDGRAIMTAIKCGIEVALISGGSHPNTIMERAKRLGVKRLYVGTEPKLNILKTWVEEIGITLGEVAHIGDDANDLDLMRAVGYSACPADAAVRNQETADLILSQKGGNGCVREFIELYLGVDVD